MELLIDKKKTEHLNCFDKDSAIHEESTEIIVSDKSPDIERIIKGDGHVFIKNKDVRENKISAEGFIKGVVLYMADEEKCVRKLDVSMPFYHTFDADGVNADTKVLMKAVMRSFDVREINPRKVSVRANIELTYRAYDICDEEVCESIPEALKYGMQEKYKEIQNYKPIKICEKSFSVNDDIELSGKDTELSCILYGDVSLVPTEKKIIGNKAIVKGLCEVGYVYATEDGLLHNAEHELPFSQILDVDGMEDGHELEIMLTVSGYDFDVSYDASGKARYMTVSVTGDMGATVYEKSEMRTLSDAYSTSHNLDVKRRELSCSRFVKKIEKRVPHSETVQLEKGVKKVLYVSVNPQMPVRRRDAGGEIVSSDVVISVMYICEDDSLYGVTRRTNVLCPVEISENRNYEVSTAVRGKSYSQGNDKELNVRFFMDFDITETENEKCTVVCKIEAEDECTETKAKAPSICVMKISERSAVWDIAKEHFTSVSEICYANGMENTEYIEKGKTILIPKCR